MLAIRNLDVSFGRGEDAVHAVRQLSFEVAEGEWFGLVGESGSGKSTVLRAVSGLLLQWEGVITVAGQPQRLRRARAFHRLVQMVFQDPYGSLHPRHTVDRALAEPVAIHGLRDADQRIRRALIEVGLDPSFLYRFPHQLSGGQRQRVAIARALIVEPKVLLLDEPTSALDVSIQAEILNLLKRLRREHGLTAILVSHNLAVVAHMCERLGVMQNGALVEELTTDQLRAATPREDYTRQLLAASTGYNPEAVALEETA
jgi:ABC-type dipeptide/oligopeptide/nickel transport system ATPase subunit